MRYGINILCELFGNTRQAYYKNKKSSFKEHLAEDLIISLVRKIRVRQKRLGTNKLLKMIRSDLPADIQIGRDAMFDLLRRNNLLVRKRRHRAYTTNSFHWLRKYPNLIKGIVPDGPNKLWVSDITYIKTSKGFVYLSLVTDAYSRKIVGWYLTSNIHASNPLKALHMAIAKLPYGIHGLIHHSDRGIQYCSSKYTSCLQKHDIAISMTEHGDPYENAIAERVNGILKTEWIYDMNFRDLDHARTNIKEIISIYNMERPHCSIEMLTPSQAHEKSGLLTKTWKSYKRKNVTEKHDKI